MAMLPICNQAKNIYSAIFFLPELVNGRFCEVTVLQKIQ